jgi:hypothetical protein
MSATDVDLLFDFAVEHPEGFTYYMVEAKHRWDRSRFFETVRKLRMVCVHDDEITLVCVPQGAREAWLYRLVGVASDPDARIWQANRLGDLEARLDTSENVATVLAAQADARTVVGRKARKIANTLGYLKGELQDLSQGGGGQGSGQGGGNNSPR